MNSLYKTKNGKKEILKLYDQKLADLGIVSVSKMVETSFGSTNAIIAGDSSKPPIIVVHGSNGCAPIALETYSDLLHSFSVYAVDVLAQPNKSAETRLSMKDLSYGEWMHEVIDELGIEDVKLAGFSFGGLVILKTLMYKQENIKEVFLSAPAYIVNGNPLKAIIKFFIPMRRFMRTRKSKYLQQFLDVTFTEKDDFAFNYLSKIFIDFEMDFAPIPVIKKSEAAKIVTPITLITAQDDIVFPGVKMIKRATKIFPSLKHTVLLENSRHVQNREDNLKINNLIINSK